MMVWSQTAFAATVALALTLSACAPTPPPMVEAPPPAPVKVIEIEPFVSKVVSVNQRTREIVLSMPGGDRVAIVAGPEVRNFAQVRRGDTVRVTLGEAIAVALAAPGSAPAEPVAAVVRRPRGQRPGAIVGERRTVRMTVTEVDPTTGRVAATNPQGIRRVVTPQDPALIEFAKRLSPGDQVDVTYTEVVAIRVDPNDR